METTRPYVFMLFRSALRRLVSTIILAFCSASTAWRAAAQPAVSACAPHPSVLSFTISRVGERLDPKRTDTATVNYNRKYGLTGASMQGVGAVSDTAMCRRALRAYINASEPFNETRRQEQQDFFKTIAVVRILPNRYLLNVGLGDRYWGHEMFLTDSTFRPVARYF